MPPVKSKNVKSKKKVAVPVAKVAAKAAAKAVEKSVVKVAPAAAGAMPTQQGLVRLLEDDGSVLKGKDPNLPKDTLLFLYEQMVQVREFDRRMLMLQRQGRIGFYGPILGQEAATVGSVAALQPKS